MSCVTKYFDQSVKYQIIKLIDQEEFYYLDVAKALKIDVNELINLYKCLRLNYEIECGYFNCIRRLTSAEDEAKHFKKCHKDNRMISNELIDTCKSAIEILNSSKEFIQSIKTKYNKFDQSYIAYIIFDLNFDPKALIEKIFANLFSTDTYFGQIIYRKNEKFISRIVN